MPYTEYNLIREVSADDVIANVPRDAGESTLGFKTMKIKVVPADGANPAIGLYYWNDVTSKWIQDHTPIAFAAKGANVSWVATVDTYGRRFLLAVTSGTGSGSTKIYTAGAEASDSD